LWGHPTDHVTFGYNAEAALSATAPVMRETSKTATVALGGSTTLRPEGAEKIAAHHIADDLDAVDEQDDRAAATRRLIPQESVQQAHAIFTQAATRFRQSPMLHIFFARFYAVFQGNKHMQMSHLLQAERRQPPLDVAFLVFQARKLAEGAGGSNGQLSAMNRVTFEKYAADARKFVLRASTRQVAFWMELCDNVPDVSRLHRLSSEMNDAITQAEHAFTQLFTLNAQSLVIMRLYAVFNLHVTCNADKAQLLLSEADRIEDQKSKDHRNEVAGGVLPIMEESNLDVFADSTAVITIGGTSRNLGIVTSINSAGCKLFGFSRLQLERRSVFSLLPYPLNDNHEASLEQYGMD
jgi:PAS domain-containing protein